MTDTAEATSLDTPAEAGQVEGVGADATNGTTAPDDLFDYSDVADKHVAITVAGQTEYVPLSEALNGYQRQSDYTRKTQEVAQERQRLAQAEALFNALDADPEAVITALANELGVATAQGVPANEQATEATDGAIDPYAAKLNELEQWRDQTEQAAATQELNGQLTNLHSKYDASFGDSGFDDSQFLAFCMQTNAWPLEAGMLLFREIQGNAQKDFKEQKDAAEQQRTAAASAAGIIESGTGRNSGAAVPGGTLPSIEDALQAAMNAHGGWA